MVLGVEASHRHGMPVDEQVYYDIKDDFRSTYPASIAFEAARLQGKRQGKRYLRGLRVAAAAERAFQEDLVECRARGVRGFPSYLIRGRNGQEVLLRGYILFEIFETWFEEFAGGELIRNELSFGLTQVYDFVSRKGATAAGLC